MQRLCPANRGRKFLSTLIWSLFNNFFCSRLVSAASVDLAEGAGLDKKDSFSYMEGEKEFLQESSAPLERRGSFVEEKESKEKPIDEGPSTDSEDSHGVDVVRQRSGSVSSRQTESLHSRGNGSLRDIRPSRLSIGSHSTLAIEKSESRNPSYWMTRLANSVTIEGTNSSGHALSTGWRPKERVQILSVNEPPPGCVFRLGGLLTVRSVKYLGNLHSKVRFKYQCLSPVYGGHLLAAVRFTIKRSAIVGGGS